MASLLGRYLAGEYIPVWDELCRDGNSNDLPSDDEVAVLREAMRRARANIETLAARLPDLGYRFGYWEANGPIPHYVAPYVGPSDDAADLVAGLQTIVGPLPLSIRLWCELVGTVDFRGYHPKWRVDYPDPICVELPPVSHVRSSFDEWRIDGGAAENGPFRLDLAPDYYHKANVSGGSPYAVEVPNSAIDAIFVEEPNRTTFVNYLRLCFAWGGFPGLRNCTQAILLGHIKVLTEGLLEI